VSPRPAVHLVSPAAAQSLELLFLQNAQEFRLQCQGNIADLVQKERSLVGHFEAPQLLGDGSRESSPLVAKEFAFQQIEWNGSAIQFYEWLSTARTQTVSGLCDEFLTCACFSQD